MKYTVEELEAICEKHIKWLRGEAGGKKANLRGADLRGADLREADLCLADLRGANLYGANLREADLCLADLRGADLREADLREADLREADLCLANLRGVDLCGVDLYRANLRGADLCGVDLREADLRGVDLREANLYRANLRGAKNVELAAAITLVPCEGAIIGWKKAHAPDGGYCIVKLRVPEGARRSSATGRKCRAEYAEVLEVIGAEYGVSDYDRSVEYRVGQTVRPDSFNDNRWEECSNGIHFFVTRVEAEGYDL